jgi:hypothetical protein
MHKPTYLDRRSQITQSEQYLGISSKESLGNIEVTERLALPLQLFHHSLQLGRLLARNVQDGHPFAIDQGAVIAPALRLQNTHEGRQVFRVFAVSDELDERSLGVGAQGLHGGIPPGLDHVHRRHVGFPLGVVRRRQLGRAGRFHGVPSPVGNGVRLGREGGAKVSPRGRSLD